jgi:hypothetical protein
MFHKKDVKAIPVISLHAPASGKPFTIHWQVINENKVQFYSIEYSRDGKDFKTIGQLPSDLTKNGNYTWVIAKAGSGENFYRVRSFGPAESTCLSNEVQLSVPAERILFSHITVAPNPAIKGCLQFYFSKQEKGVYALDLFNPLGQTVYTGSSPFGGGNGYVDFTGIPILSGVYRARLTKPNGTISRFVIVY